MTSTSSHSHHVTDIRIHRDIEIGTSTLRVRGEELVCLVEDRLLRVYLEGDRFVLTGGQWGDHSLDARETITTADRLLAHWRGYCENHMRRERAVACVWGGCNGTRPSKHAPCDRCGSRRP